MRFGRGLVAVVCGLLLGCRSDEATGSRGALGVVVDPASIVSLRNAVNPPGGFGGQAVLRNSTEFDLRVNACAPDVEREVTPGEWVTVLRRYCTMQLDLSDIAVPAMTDVPISWAAWAPFSGAGSTAGIADLSGRYRLVYRYRIEGYVDDLEEARSAPFEVTD